MASSIFLYNKIIKRQRGTRLCQDLEQKKIY